MSDDSNSPANPGQPEPPDEQLAPPDWGPRRNVDGTYSYAFVVDPDRPEQAKLLANQQALADAAARAVDAVESETVYLTPVGPGTVQVLYSPDGKVSLVASRNCLASPQTAEAINELRTAMEMANSGEETPATVAALLENARAAARDCGTTLPRRLEADARATIGGPQ